MGENVDVVAGATRSEKAPGYNLVPGFAFRRVAVRFQVGAAIHGADNWKKACQTEKDAAAWCAEAYNHMMEHIHKMKTGSDPDDDHIGAIGWALEIFAYCENLYKRRWTELGRPPLAHAATGKLVYGI